MSSVDLSDLSKDTCIGLVTVLPTHNLMELCRKDVKLIEKFVGIYGKHAMNAFLISDASKFDDWNKLTRNLAKPLDRKSVV